MTTTTVTDSVTLNAALTMAQPGDTIQLAAGTYSGINALNLTFAQDVTLTSANPLAPAVITDININSTTGLALSNLEFQANAAFGDNPFRVTSSQDIHFDHLNVHGSLDGNPQDDVVAFLIRGSTDVSVTNSEFQQLHDAIGQLDNTDLTISGNRFHDIRTDAIRGGGSSNVTISHNTFSDFYPVVGDHGDAIQFWTTNTSASAHDITITDNMFIRGGGGVAQGIFIADEVGSLPYINVTISGNTIIGGMYNGIAIGGGQNVTIDHNNVVGFSDMKSWIRLDNVDTATLTSNNADAFLISATTDKNILQTGSATLPLATDAGAAALGQWQAAHPGANQLIGTDGDDTLSGGAGVDYIRGGAGDDSISGGGGFDDLNGNQGNDTIHGNAGDDWVVGGKGDDLLFGDAGNDLILGNLGNDTLDGGTGNDTLRGGQGDDSLSGGPGDDWLSGDRGNDTLTGGPGADTFHSSSGAGMDLVTDFNAAEGDRIQLDPGTVYSVYQSGADTVIDMGNGDHMVLAGVQSWTLPPGWIFTG